MENKVTLRFLQFKIYRISMKPETGKYVGYIEKYTHRVILKFSDLKGNLVLIFPLNRQQIAE